MVRDNGCMYVAKIESSMLTHQLPCKYARLHLGSALVHTGQSQLLCAVAVCVSTAWPWQRWPQLMGKGHKAPGSSWKVGMCSRDTNTGLAGDNLGRGLGTFCCNINSVNDILLSIFSTELLAHVAGVLNCCFPRTANPCLGYLKTSGLCRQLLLGSKKVPKIFGCPMQH